jgi:GAF domain-containing protein/CheY-like chemotaxis protein
LLVSGAGAGAAVTPTAVTLGDLNQRSAPDYAPRNLGQGVAVRGTVNARAYHFPSYTVLTIDDGTNGASIEVRNNDTRLEAFQPGDEVLASGKVFQLAGMTMLDVEHITLVGRQRAPAEISVSLADLRGFRYLGRLVRVRGQIRAVADTISGAYLDIKDDAATYRIFLPRTQELPAPKLDLFSVGDRIEVEGSAFQYDTRPPFDHGFELLARGPAAVTMLSKHALVPPWTLIAALMLVLAAALALWSREHRMRVARERVRKIYNLGEEILSASSDGAILKRIEEALPLILNVTRVRLYKHNRAAKTLDGIAGEAVEPVSISLDTPPAGPQAGAVACFHYRTLLVIPDVERSPFPMAARGLRPGNPKSLLLVPMMAQGEVVGVLELDQNDRVRDFSADEQAMAQHLGNQIGVALRLLGQRSVQEQLFRTEKLAAVGRLISGVVNELQTPLASISDLARRVVERYHGPADRELNAIAAEARRAASIMARLVSFAAAEQVEARPVSMGQLLRGLIEFREGDWKASGIRVRDLTSRESLTVLGSEGQLEQVFLNLLVHAEQALAEAPEKAITIRTSVLAKRLLVEIAFTAPSRPSNPEETATILGLARSVIAGHGGEVRMIERPNAAVSFEVELPLSSKDRPLALAQAPTAANASAMPAGAAAGPAGDTARRMTALVIEPDEAAQRQLLALLSGRGYRVVPVNNSDTGLELAHRMRFDAAFCSVHAPGLNWVELSERMYSRVNAFILLSDGDDQELSADFEGDGRFVISKPFQQAELERALRYAEHPVAKVVPIKNDVA